MNRSTQLHPEWNTVGPGSSLKGWQSWMPSPGSSASFFPSCFSFFRPLSRERQVHQTVCGQSRGYLGISPPTPKSFQSTEVPEPAAQLLCPVGGTLWPVNLD